MVWMSVADDISHTVTLLGRDIGVILAGRGGGGGSTLVLVYL